MLVRAEMLHIKARHHSFHPGRKIHPAHLAVHHFSPASFAESSQAAPRLLTLMLLMSASVPRGTAPCFYCGGPARAPLTVEALVPTSAPLSLPSDSQRPTLRAGWEARVRPLWDAGQMMGRWTLRSAAGLHFRGVFPPGCSPAPSPLPLSPVSCT